MHYVLSCWAATIQPLSDDAFLVDRPTSISPSSTCRHPSSHTTHQSAAFAVSAALVFIWEARTSKKYQAEKMSTQSKNLTTLVANQAKTTLPDHMWAPKKKTAFKDVDTISRVDTPVMSSPTAKRDGSPAQSKGGRPLDRANLQTSHLDEKPFKTKPR
ncbi:hypothetical protein MCOR03_006524 [Pyricularia oryzae]|nr:hypothetical protein MCOR01_004759 [Pyricularia oryzae]KAI6378046.1 hypothetical protein MCOR31_000897 [Pyricularia oryzae]KAI6388453.1 hypothetical protein MCOR32_000338 [Pyricularia oryzae]KAI6394593.1 hypothetical protein MCOR23_007464 [Pyricularia oryzae]KAI6435686.1 hypothetical protein MCOR21_001635 [Pyricularia oryzae]